MATAPFDIFQTDADGSVLWLETAATVEAAKARVGELVVHAPHTYIILNHQTGDKLVMGPNGAVSQQALSAYQIESDAL